MAPSDVPPPQDDTEPEADDTASTIAQIRKRVIIWWAIRWGLMSAFIIFFGLQSPRSFWAFAVMIPLALISLYVSLWNIRKYERKLAEWEHAPEKEADPGNPTNSL